MHCRCGGQGVGLPGRCQLRLCPLVSSFAAASGACCWRSILWPRLHCATPINPVCLARALGWMASQSGSPYSLAQAVGATLYALPAHSRSPDVVWFSCSLTHGMGRLTFHFTARIVPLAARMPWTLTASCRSIRQGALLFAVSTVLRSVLLGTMLAAMARHPLRKDHHTYFQ